jgi:hypothetical protein
MVGVATIFDRKPERDRHWSVPPTWPVDEESDADDAGEP